jgi:rubredoxin
MRPCDHLEEDEEGIERCSYTGNRCYEDTPDYCRDYEAHP